MQHDKKKSKLFANKKGVNDVSIIAIILSIFIFSALALTFVNAEFGTSDTGFNTEGVSNNLVSEDLSNVSDIGVGSILVSLGKVFFWTFGDFPFWLDAIYTILRIMLLVILIRNFTPFLGGGG